MQTPLSTAWSPPSALLSTVGDAELATIFPRPRLVVVIDTEEEFDWTRPLQRSSTSVEHIPAQALAQEIFRRHGIVPVYVVDYPVANTETSAAFFRELVAEGSAEIGAHLHPWVNPPHVEDVNSVNSYPGNLSMDLERAKLSELVNAIEAGIGIRPTVYKAGRYGFGPNTIGILQNLGFTVDCSMVARTSFAGDGGPDYRNLCHRPKWLDATRQLLELPLTVGFVGRVRTIGPRLFPYVASQVGTRLHVPGVLARSGFLERIRLSPEGADFYDLKRLTDVLLEDGGRVFCLAYHSPSLEPGCTPYVRSRDQLRAFLRTLEQFVCYFTEELGGVPATPDEVRRALETV